MVDRSHSIHCHFRARTLLTEQGWFVMMLACRMAVAEKREVTMIDNRSAPPGPVVPVLAYDHVEKAIEWLSGAFGFTERLRIMHEGRIHRVQMAAGQGGVVLVPPRKPEQAGKARVFVRVKDAHAHYAQGETSRRKSKPSTAGLRVRRTAIRG
jgi:hypothetical protein